MSALQHSYCKNYRHLIPLKQPIKKNPTILELNKPLRISTAKARYYFELDISQNFEPPFTKVLHTYIDAFDFGVNLYESDEGRILLQSYIQQKVGLRKIRFYEFV
jgi:hypothetical protein